MGEHVSNEFADEKQTSHNICRFRWSSGGKFSVVLHHHPQGMCIITFFNHGCRISQVDGTEIEEYVLR